MRECRGRAALFPRTAFTNATRGYAADHDLLARFRRDGRCGEAQSQATFKR